MSLVKKPTMTSRKLAANRANAQFSRGPLTPEGKEHLKALAAQVARGVVPPRNEGSNQNVLWTKPLTR
jgi:hypothetical protein